MQRHGNNKQLSHSVWYFPPCDIITALWKELAGVCVTDGLISHAVGFGSSAESSCTARCFFTPAGSSGSLEAEVHCPSSEVSGRLGSMLCVFRKRWGLPDWPKDCQANLSFSPALWEWNCGFPFSLFLLSRPRSWTAERYGLRVFWFLSSSSLQESAFT